MLIIVSFIVCTLLIVLSGALAVLRKTKTTGDYLIASQNVKPWLASLSAVATNNSGFMFIGMIGFTFRDGLHTLWLGVGWVFGDMLLWFFVHGRVRALAGQKDIHTLSELIGHQGGVAYRKIILACGAVTILFLAVYAAAQLKAGGTALHTLLAWDMHTGVLIGAGIVILYSYAGGIRADIWTDAAQSFVMFITMLLVLIVGVAEIGGIGELFANLKRQDPKLLRLFPEDPQFGVAAYLAGFLFAGLTALGQPHIMTRFMAIESVKAIRPAGFYYFLWYIPFYAMSVAVGLVARALIPDLAASPLARGLVQPTEIALPLLSMQLLPEIFVGMVLAGLFAATISTADSQIIVCSGAITQDMKPRWKHSYRASKLATFAVAALAVALALYAPEGVFGLVRIAWSALGASLGPLLLLRIFDIRFSTVEALSIMTAGVAAVIAWELTGWSGAVFSVLPGVIAAGIAWLAFRLFPTRDPG